MIDNKHLIVGVHITDRVKNARDVQNVLTEFGCSIKTRLGLHEVHENQCATSGIIILELTGSSQDSQQLMTQLTNIPGVDIQKMEFKH